MYLVSWQVTIRLDKLGKHYVILSFKVHTLLIMGIIRVCGTAEFEENLTQTAEFCQCRVDK